MSYNLGKSGSPFIAAFHECRGIVEVLLEGAIGIFVLSAAGMRSILHICGHPEIVHQERNSICFIICPRVSIGISVFHMLPIVMRLAEIGVLLLIIISDGIGVFSLSLCRPLVEIHHLCHCRSHASRVIITDLFIVREVLAPFAGQQRSNGFVSFRSSCCRLHLCRRLL